MENDSIQSLSLDTYLYSDTPKRLIRKTTNPFVKITIVAWYELLDMFENPVGFSQYLPNWGQTFFTPGKSDASFRLWAEKGLRMISNLYRTNTLMTFENLKEKFGIPSTH